MAKNIIQSESCEDDVSSLELHVHNDIEEAAKWYKIPLALYNEHDVYVMQEDRCVFVGSNEAINRAIHSVLSKAKMIPVEVEIKNNNTIFVTKIL